MSTRSSNNAARRCAIMRYKNLHLHYITFTLHYNYAISKIIFTKILF